MKSFIIACVALVVLALPRYAAAQSAHHPDSKKSDVHISEPLVVGTATLKPGDYTFQCRGIDGRDFLVVTDADGQEVARVPCTPENLPEKVKMSEFRSRTQPDGTKALSSVRIKGETIEHRVTGN